MCEWCGRIWCGTDCPGYEPRRDPAVTGWCRVCGTPLYEVGAAFCRLCDEERERDNGIE